MAIPSTTFPEVSRFCPDHQEQLDQVREKIEERNWENNVRNKENATTSFCETPGCDSRPVYGGDHCADCQGGDD